MKGVRVMGVPKNKQKLSNISYFDHAYKMIEGITKYLLLDFGVTHTYNCLTVFIKKAKMDEKDGTLFEELVNKYHLETESSFPLWLILHYRDRILNIMDSILSHISAAYTMFPNSVYEFNIKRQHQSDAIYDCYELKHVLQLAINIFPADLKKYVPYITMIDDEIGYLKTWRKDYAAKNKKQCYMNDDNARRTAAYAVEKALDKADSKKPHDSTVFFLPYITQNTQYMINHDQLMFNLANTNFYYDSQNRYCSTLFVPAVTFCDPKGNVIGDGVTK